MERQLAIGVPDVWAPWPRWRELDTSQQQGHTTWVVGLRDKKQRRILDRVDMGLEME